MKLSILLLSILLISTVYSKVEWQQGKDSTLQWSGAGCQHTLSCDTEIGRFVDVDVQFATPFSTAPQVALSINALDLQKAFPLSFDITLQSTRVDGFTYRVTSYTATPLYTFHVNWVALLDSRIRIQYVHQHLTPTLGDTSISRVDGVSTSHIVNYDRPLECENPQTSVFVLGGEATQGSKEFSVFALDFSNPSYAEIDISTGNGYLEWVSFVVVAGCADNAEAFYLGQQVEGQGTNWTTGSGKRMQDFEHQFDKMNLINQGGFVFHGISAFDVPGDAHNLRVNVASSEVLNDTYQISMGTWAGTIVNGLFIDGFSYLPQNQCAILYSECDYQGESLQVCSGEPINSLAARDWADKEVKSVSVPYGRTLSLFDANNLEGPYTQVKSDVSCSSGWTFT